MAGSRSSEPNGAGRPGPDGHHDDLLPSELDKISVDIPDDASALSGDRERWLAEEALDELASDRPQRDDEPRLTDDGDGWTVRRAARRRRLVITAAVVIVSMAVVAISGAVGALIVGPQASAPPAAPLAEDGLPAGQIGGLLPADAVLQNGEATLDAQSVRPAVLVLVPEACLDCAELLTGLAPQAGSFGVPLIAVGSPSQAQQLDSLADATGTARLVTLTDPDDRLRQTYGLTGITVLLVRDDGVVVDIVRDPLPDLRLEGVLIDLVPGVGLGT